MLVAATAFALVTSACTRAEQLDNCPGGQIIGGECVTEGSGSAFADTSVARQSDGSGSVATDLGSSGTGSGNDNTTPDDPTTGATDEPGADHTTADDTSEWDCADGVAGARPVGAGCERHCECGSSYCYDEAYLGEFRFCTLEGAGGCNTRGGGDGVTSHTTLNLNHSALSALGLTKTIICQPICQTVADCAPLSSAYDKCGTSTPGGTHWGSTDTASYLTLSLQRTCQIAAEVAELP